jgi:hypothetical protein
VIIAHDVIANRTPTTKETMAKKSGIAIYSITPLFWWWASLKNPITLRPANGLFKIAPSFNHFLLLTVSLLSTALAAGFNNFFMAVLTCL